MKLYYNTKGYGAGENKSIFTIMNDDLTLMWNINLSKESDINELVKCRQLPWYTRKDAYSIDTFIYVCDITKPIDLHTIKHIYPEFFL